MHSSAATCKAEKQIFIDVRLLVVYFFESVAAALQMLLCCMIDEVDTIQKVHQNEVFYASKVFQIAFCVTGNGHLKFTIYLQNTLTRTVQSWRAV